MYIIKDSDGIFHVYIHIMFCISIGPRVSKSTVLKGGMGVYTVHKYIATYSFMFICTVFLRICIGI